MSDLSGMYRSECANCKALRARVAELEQWKSEAMLVLEEWEKTWVSAGKPGKWGSSKSASVRARVAELEAELLRVRTTGHGAAHALDNIGVENGLGANASPLAVQEFVRQLAAARAANGEVGQ